MLTEEQEQLRLAALDRYDLLDTPREESFDRIARLAKKLLRVPVAAVSVLDAHRQWYKAAEGLPETEAPRQHTFCTVAIQENGPLVVNDATADTRFRDNPFVLNEPGLRFYAGVPLRTADGHNIGTICVAGNQARELAPEELESLVDLAGIATRELELRLVASTDSLTGAMSRRAFKEAAALTVKLALRHHHDASCIALDVDHFKSINDRYGHPFGDLVLQGIVASITPLLRTTDLVGRLGGEEFAVLLPHTGTSGAVEVAEKLRSAVDRLRIPFDGDPVQVSASFGVASLGGATRDLEGLLKEADAALYDAKRAGRNRVVARRRPEDQVAPQRRRVLKGGQILFNGRASSIDCTVRSLSDASAGLDVYDSLHVPKMFELAIRADAFVRPCRVLGKTEKHIEVEFCH